MSMLIHRVNVSDLEGSFDAVRDAIASAVAGAEVTLVRVSYEPLDDRDGFGGTHRAVLEAPGVRVEEAIVSNDEGSAREGFGYTMTWRFIGMGAREGRGAFLREHGLRPTFETCSIDVTGDVGAAIYDAIAAVQKTRRGLRGAR